MALVLTAQCARGRGRAVGGEVAASIDAFAVRACGAHIEICGVITCAYLLAARDVR